MQSAYPAECRVKTAICISIHPYIHPYIHNPYIFVHTYVYLYINSHDADSDHGAPAAAAYNSSDDGSAAAAAGYAPAMNRPVAIYFVFFYFLTCVCLLGVSRRVVVYMPAEVKSAQGFKSIEVNVYSRHVS
jgi:hypothetical protein